MDTVATTLWRKAAMMAGSIILAFTLAAWGEPETEAPAPDAPESEAGATEIPSESVEAKPGTESPEQLAVEQQRIADRFQRLEHVLLRMAELTASADPQRAALLRKTVAQGKERLIDMQFERLAKLLEQDQLARAVENHADIQKDLAVLLELLQSENRAKQLTERKKRLGEYIKELNRIIKTQENLKHRTGGSGDPKRLAPEQKQLADRTGGLSDDIRKNEEPGDGEGSAKGKEGEGSEAEGKAGKEGGEAEGKERGDAEGKERGAEEGKEGGEGEGKQSGEVEGESQDAGEGGGKKGDGQGGGQGGGEGKEGQQGEGQEDTQPPNPARQRLERAQQNMKDAEENLKKAQREGAVEDQEKALEELRQAKAELEEILRQLREEEMKRMLAMLEARFRQMLDIQIEVYEGTKRLDAVPADRRTFGHEIESTRLGNREQEIAVLIERVWLLLEEDGTTLAMPLAVDELRDDVREVVARLAEAKVDAITQGIEEDIIASLEEIIEALKKAMKDLEDQQPPSPPMEGEPAEMPLVDLLAELKMIRALQMRVNKRTQRYSKLIDGEQTDNAELVEQLRQLAQRQQRVYRVTRDLHLGKNQ